MLISSMFIENLMVLKGRGAVNKWAINHDYINVLLLEMGKVVKVIPSSWKNPIEVFRIGIKNQPNHHLPTF